MTQMGYVRLAELTGCMRGTGAHCKQRRIPWASHHFWKKEGKAESSILSNSLFLYPSSGPSSANIPRASFLIIYALQLLSISNHTFILAQNNLLRYCLQEHFSWSTFTFKTLFLWTLHRTPLKTLCKRKLRYRAKWTSCPKTQNNNLVFRNLIFNWLAIKLTDIKWFLYLQKYNRGS